MGGKIFAPPPPPTPTLLLTNPEGARGRNAREANKRRVLLEVLDHGERATADRLACLACSVEWEVLADNEEKGVADLQTALHIGTKIK